LLTCQVTEELLTLLLPFLVSGLQESATRDYRAATLMVLTQLLSHASLSKDFLTGEQAQGDVNGCDVDLLTFEFYEHRRRCG
jgi:hypothetical protein